ncbi:MAG: serine/threonine-protein phosphatase, partial [Myxococcales bacterium]
MTVAWPRLVVAQQTDPGREPSKQENEDAVVYQELHAGHLLLVCDGMGGHSSGREASTLAVQTIVNELARTPAGADPGEALRAAIEEANRRVYALGGASTHARPGSTCVAVLVHPMGVEVAHLGDSRAYLLRSGQLWPLTRDHSMVQEMVASGLLRPEDAINHPDGNKITRALGMSAEAVVELRQERLLQQTGDIYLLVSDGVTDVVRDSDLQAMATVAAHETQMAQLCAQVVQLALARGGPDNTTILAASIADPGLRPEAAQQPPRRLFASTNTVVETIDSSAPQLPPPNLAGATLPGVPAPVLGPAGAPA